MALVMRPGPAFRVTTGGWFAAIRAALNPVEQEWKRAWH
jgi:hypothetical protein